MVLYNGSMPEASVPQSRVLAKVAIFSGLTENELDFLSQRALPRKFSAGQSVFGEGEPCSGLYVVESGHVRIFKSSANGREQVLSIDGPGSSIAELPVFDGGNYPASGTAIDDATLLFVSKQDFQVLCLAHPQVALKVLRVVGARLRRLVGIIEELSFTTVRHRLTSTSPEYTSLTPLMNRRSIGLTGSGGTRWYSTSCFTPAACAISPACTGVV